MDRIPWVGILAGAVIVFVAGLTGWAIYEHIVAPHAGVVHSRAYSPAHSNVVCTSTGKSLICVPEYVGPEWSFDLYARDGNHGWRDVSEGDYQRYHVGDYYPG